MSRLEILIVASVLVACWLALETLALRLALTL